MPATLTATPDLGNVPPRVRLDVALPAGSVGVSVLIVRTDPDGRSYPVRLADPAVLTGSAWLGWDYEAPYGVPLTYSATVIYKASSRANLVANPSFEVDTAGWNGVRDTTQAWVGAASQRVDTSVPGWAGWQGNYQPAKPATTYTASAYVRGTGSVALFMFFAPSSASVSGPTVALTGAWQRVSVTGTTPAGSTGTRILYQQLGAGACSIWMDAVLLEESPSVGAYFDGATPDTGASQYDWLGVPHASTSTESPLASSTVTETQAAATSLAVSDVWLIHPGIPALSMMLASVKSLGDRLRLVSRGIFQPYGRTEPIVITDGRRKAVQAQLMIRTRTLAELAALVALTADAAVLLLNVPLDLGWGVSAEYVSLGDLAESREVATGNDPCRVFTSPYLVVARPVGGSQSQRTYADLLAESVTYQGVLDTRASYLELLAPTS